MKIRSTRLLTLLILLPFLGKSQNAIEPYIGYSVDLANKPSFNQVNIGVQYPIINYKFYQLLIRVQGGIPLTGVAGNDAAYSSNPSLPLSVAAGYKAKWYSGAFMLTNRFRAVSWADKNIISPFVNVGIVYQKITVQHNSYDKEKYTILNSHRLLKKEGLFIGAGVQYKHAFNGGAVFVQAEFFSSPLVNKVNNYDYKMPVPLAINIGYVIEFKKEE